MTGAWKAENNTFDNVKRAFSRKRRLFLFRLIFCNKKGRMLIRGMAG